MLKSVLKCIESIRIKDNGLTFLKNSESQLGEGGSPAKLVKSKLCFLFF